MVVVVCVCGGGGSAEENLKTARHGQRGSNVENEVLQADGGYIMEFGGVKTRCC